MKYKVIFPVLALGLFLHCQKEPSNPRQVIPTLLEPADGTSDYYLNAIYRWSEIQGAEKYEVQVSADVHFSQLFDSAQVAAAQSVSHSILYSDATYFWRVRARIDGSWQSWSDTAMFKTGYRYNVPNDFRKRFEGTYILRDSVAGLECIVYNPPSSGLPPCGQYGNYSYILPNDTLVVKFDSDNSLRVEGTNLEDTTGYIDINGHDGLIHSNGTFYSYFSWTCTSKSITGYFRNDSLVYKYYSDQGGCTPIYSVRHYKGKRQ